MKFDVEIKARIPRKDKKAIGILAREQQLFPSDIIRAALREYIASNTAKKCECGRIQ